MSTTTIQDDVAALVAAFSLTAAHIEQLARTIYEQARVPTYSARYQHAARTLKIPLPADWQPSDAALRKLAADALASAKRIAQTYQQDLERQARHLVAQKALQHDLVDPATGLAAWAKERLTWKSLQIANDETNEAGDEASSDFYTAVNDGTLTTETDLDGILLLVLPFDAREPFCQEYAGNWYTWTEAASLFGLFPAHSNCPHWLLFLPIFEQEALAPPAAEEY